MPFENAQTKQKNVKNKALDSRVEVPDISKGKLKPSSKPHSSDCESRKLLNIDTQSTRIENGNPIEMQPMLNRKSESHHTTTISNANSDKNASKNTETNCSTPNSTPLMPESVASEKPPSVLLKGISPSPKSPSNHSIHSIPPKDISAEIAFTPTSETKLKNTKTWSSNDENKISKHCEGNTAQKSTVLWI